MPHSLRPTTDADSTGLRSFRLRAALVLLALGTIAYSGLAALKDGGDFTRARRHSRSTAFTPSAPGLAAARIGLLAQTSDPASPRAPRVTASDADFAAAEGRRGLLKFGAATGLQLEYRGEEMPVAALSGGVAQPRVLASSDLDRDGAPDLIAGYAHDGVGIVTVQRGNTDAFAPKDDSVFQRMQRGYDPDSLLPEATAYSVPEPVDFLQVGLFDHDNRRDAVVAALGGGLYFLAGDGAGGFGRPQKVDLPGTVTALAAGEFRAADGRTDIAVGITGATGPKALVFDGAAGGFGSEPLTVPLKSDSVAVEFGELDGDPFMDLAIAAGREVLAVHGWGRKTHVDIEARIERIALPFAARSVAVENLLWDREGAREIAALSAEGSVHLLERRGRVKRALSAEESAERAALRGRISRRNEDVETVRGWSADSAPGWIAAGAFALDAAAGREAPVQGLLARAKIAPGETNSLLVLDAARRGLEILGRVDGIKPLASGSADLSTTSLAVGGAPVAVVALPKKLNGVRDLAVLKSGFVGPSIVPQGVTATIVVDRTDDTAAASACTAALNDCSLRGAVLFANATPGTAITLPAGTYDLTIVGNTNNMGAGEGFSGNPSIGDLDFLETRPPSPVRARPRRSSGRPRPTTGRSSRTPWETSTSTGQSRA